MQVSHSHFSHLQPVLVTESRGIVAAILWIGEAGRPDPGMLVFELKYALISLPKGQGKAGLIVADTARDRTV
jgi:hypothetical protein